MQTKRRVRAFLLVMIGVLFVASVPWYRSTGEQVTLIFGLPDWVAVALGCYVGVAVLNSVAWLLSDVEDPKMPGDGSEPKS
ncbi:MAG: hypothetical protein P8R42_27190 [Candidatus Binatia bacterium]|nr:hypothetical protein [Candidatus Binatia bacterium]